MEEKGFFKQKTNQIGQKIVAIFILVAMFMVDLAPMVRAVSIVTQDGIYETYDGAWVTLQTTNREILEKIKYLTYQRIRIWFKEKNYYFDSSANERISSVYSTGQYYNLQIPKKFLNYSDSSSNIMDFSGIYLGNNYTLPNFSEFGNLETIKFHSCSINTLQPFETAYRNGYLQNIKNIDLGVLNNIELKSQIQNLSLFKDPDINISYTFPAGVDTHLTSTPSTTGKSTVYTITYNANGGTGAPSSQKKEQGKTINLSTKKPTRDGYTFLGWSSVKGSQEVYNYNPGDAYSKDSDKTLYAVWKKNGSATTGKKEDDETNETIVTYYTTTTWSWGYNGNIWIDDSEWNNVTKSKTLKFQASAWGDKDAYVAAEADDCWFTFNGKPFYDNTGTGYAEWEIKKNGHYEATVESPLGTCYTWSADIYNIDNKAPTFDITQNYPAKTVQEGGTRGKIVNITAKDDLELKTIKIGNQTRNVSGTENTVSFVIEQTGNYEITVTDTAGNQYTRTESIVVDNKAPEVVDCKIENMNGTKNPNVDYIAVNEGEKLKITIKCNEDDDKGIRSIGAVGKSTTSPIKGRVQVSSGTVIDGAIINQNINGNTIEIELDANKILEDIDPGEYNLSINGISDYSNNYIEQYTMPIKLLVDTIPPEVKKFEINGGTRTSDGNAVRIVPGEKLTFDLTVTEKLGESPVVEIANKRYKLEYSKQIKINSINHYVYTVTVESNEITSTEDGTVEIKLTNVKDYAGNKAEDIIYNASHNTTNNVYLIKGIYEIENLYIIPTENSSNVTLFGDINKDGYLTEYDLIKIQQYIFNQESLKNDETKYKEILDLCDINGDGELENQDYFELYKIVSNAKNNLLNEKTFVIHTKDSEENQNIKGEELTYKIYDVYGNDITSNEGYVISGYDAASGILTIELVNAQVIKVQVTRKLNDEENEIGSLYLYSGKNINSGIRINSVNNSETINMGDLNNDGYSTTYDSMVILETSVDIFEKIADKFKIDYNGNGINGFEETESATSEFPKTDIEIFKEKMRPLYDYDDDGQVTSADALFLLRKDANIACESFHGIKKGESLELHLAYIDEEDSVIKEDVSGQLWAITPLVGNSDSFVGKNATDGMSYTVTAQGEVGDRAVITVTGKDRRGQNRTCLIYLEINELEISLNKYEVQYDLSKNEEHEILFATVNMENKKVDVKSNNENVARIQIDEFGKVEVIPVGVGETTIDFTCEDKTVSCRVNVKKSITTITAPENVTVKEGDTEEIEITTNQGVTEELQFRVDNDNIAKITYNEETGKYVVHGISEGTTTITAYSPTNPEVTKTINVLVEKVVAPRLIDVTASEGYFKAGDEIKIVFTFDSEVKGTRPDLQLSFGEYPSKNAPNFVTISTDRKKITFSYIVADGDNGPLVINKLGKGLTDSTGKYDAIITYENYKYKKESIYDNNQDNGQNIEKGEFINDGVYVEMMGTIADTEKPVIELETDSFSHWLKNGDMIEIMLICRNDILKDLPTVYFNGKKANVEKYGTSNSIFKASLEVTDEMEEGYVEIVVNNYEDLAGNEGLELRAKEENIDKPIIIDRTAPDINVRVIKSREEGEKYQAGDEVKIEVNFVDKTRGTADFITSDKAPELNLTFGGKEIKGVLTNDYNTEDNKAPVTKITYTYKIAEEDVGDLRLQSITGLVEDIVGNESNINKVYEDGGYYILTKDAEGNNDNKQKYTITYDANGGTNAPARQTKEEGKDITLSKDIPSRAGYIFKGWATTKTSTKVEYESGSKYTEDKNIILYAVWEESKPGDDNKDPEDKPGDDNKDPEDKPDDGNKDKEDSTKGEDSSKDTSNEKTTKPDDSAKTTNNNKASNGKVESYNGALPYTGIQTVGFMIAGLVMFILGIAVYCINRKRNM